MSVRERRRKEGDCMSVRERRRRNPRRLYESVCV